MLALSLDEQVVQFVDFVLQFFRKEVVLVAKQLVNEFVYVPDSRFLHYIRLIYP